MPRARVLASSCCPSECLEIILAVGRCVALGEPWGPRLGSSVLRAHSGFHLLPAHVWALREGSVPPTASTSMCACPPPPRTSGQVWALRHPVAQGTAVAGHRVAAASTARLSLCPCLSGPAACPLSCLGCTHSDAGHGPATAGVLAARVTACLQLCRRASPTLKKGICVPEPWPSLPGCPQGSRRSCRVCTGLQG